MTEEQRQFVTENHNLIYSFLSQNDLSIDEYYDLAAIGLCKAALTYNDEKSKFSTYAYKCMQNSVYMEQRKYSNKKTVPEYCIVYYESKINDDGGENNFLNSFASNINVEDEVICNHTIKTAINNLKNDKYRQIINLICD